MRGGYRLTVRTAINANGKSAALTEKHICFHILFTVYNKGQFLHYKLGKLSLSGYSACSNKSIKTVKIWVSDKSNVLHINVLYL